MTRQWQEQKSATVYPHAEVARYGPSKHGHGAAPFEASRAAMHLRVRASGGMLVCGSNSSGYLGGKRGGMFPPWLQACCNGREEEGQVGSKPGSIPCLRRKPLETQRFLPAKSALAGPRVGGTPGHLSQSACCGWLADIRAQVVMPEGLASGSRRRWACCSTPPAGAAHEPGNFGTLSTLSLLSGSSEEHIVL